ncbi:MAG: hypothetical protein Q9157_000883 [Trypethelium eluteriae]
MAPKFKDGDVVASIPGSWVSWAHTVVAYAAFIGAFVVGVGLHYHKIVQNEHYGYPDEWFPSVSSTIGDRYPERSVFQVFIAITSGPRFALVALWFLLTDRPNTRLPKFVAGVGLFRTLTCGGWTYVTSTDDHDWHDIFMISYLVATLPWTLGCLTLSPPNPQAILYRKIFAGAFFGTIVPLIYFFIQHKVHKVPGAYTTYAFFEWSLVLLDVAFDAVTAMDFKSLELVVRDVKGLSRGDKKRVVDAALEKEYTRQASYRFITLTGCRKDKDIGNVFGRGFSWDEALDAIADVYNGFVFWSILTSLGLLVWYFPLWHMGISGYENMKGGSGLLTGLGLGGILFGMHSLLSDSSTMILWVWDGYPVRGPLSVPHGTVTFLAMGIGLLLGFFRSEFVRTWTSFGVASLGAAVLTCFSHWFGYSGAVVLTIYLMAITPVMFSHAVRFSPASTFGVGFLVYNFMVLFHVWVVAYAFVPGGPLVREHTDWVMTTMMIEIGAGVFSVISSAPKRSSTKAPPPNPAARRIRSYYIYILVALQLLSVSISYLRFPSYNYEPYHPQDKLITAGIWTIHFSLDNDMWSSERRQRDAIKELELDVVGLLESDTQRIIMGNRDTSQYLAEDLGMYVDYGPGPNKHTWGCVLLSKFPIVNSTHHLLPSPVGELAPAIHATIEAYGELIDVFVFHSGQEEDPEDRRLQTEYLSDLMGSVDRPAILLSYLVTKPLEGNYNTYVSGRSGMRDIDPSDWDRWCEYILYKGMKRSGYARVSRGTVTDTELQVGKFVVGESEATDNLISEDNVPGGLRFPARFRGEGVRGHRYHVFDEPRYYA